VTVKTEAKRLAMAALTERLPLSNSETLVFGDSKPLGQFFSGHVALAANQHSDVAVRKDLFKGDRFVTVSIGRPIVCSARAKRSFKAVSSAEKIGCRNFNVQIDFSPSVGNFRFRRFRHVCPPYYFNPQIEK
jgi:hypothetical protein